MNFGEYPDPETAGYQYSAYISYALLFQKELLRVT